MTPVTPFGARLWTAMAERGPLCAGIDPHATLLAQWGLPDSVAGLERFALAAAEALAPVVAAVKPQSAFFERFGSAGVAVLARTIRACRDQGALVVLDVKRGDIGSTAAAYAEGYLDPDSDLAADAVTVSPFLGFDSLMPFVDTARLHGAGLFVLALTSNPEGPEVQRARYDGRSVAGNVLRRLSMLNDEVTPLGSFGAVVGATLATPEGAAEGGPGEDLGINGPLLVPGLGAQGGTADDVRRLFAGVTAQVLASSSREILSAGPDAGRLRDGATRARDQLLQALGTSR